MRRVTACWAVLALLAAGCAAPQVQPDPDVSGKLDELMQGQQRLTLRMDELARTLLDMQDRVERMERAQAPVASPDKPVAVAEPVSEEIEAPPPSLEVVKLEPPPPPVVTSEPVAAVGAPEAAVSEPVVDVKTAAESNPATEAYGRAFNAYREGHYARSILDFEEFLLAYPAHEHADNAQYWIGESYYSQGEYDQAIVEFNRVVERYPDQPRAPDAYLMIAGCYDKLGDAQRARGFYGRLVEQYPQSEAARRASKLLSAPE